MSKSAAPRRAARRRGLTLIELVVVLIILVALAGILVPLFPSMISRAQGASGSDNVNEIVKALQLHATLTNGSFPDGYDSLILADGSAMSSLVGTPGGDFAGPFDADARTSQALHLAGIKTTYAMKAAAAGVNATFDPYDSGTFAVNASGKLVVVTDTAAQKLGMVPTINLDPTSKVSSYVAFGLGQKCTAIGKSMADAPVRFMSNGKSPTDMYARWIVVYEIPVLSGTPARLAAVVGTDDVSGIQGLNAHLNTYYQAANQ